MLKNDEKYMINSPTYGLIQMVIKHESSSIVSNFTHLLI